MRLVDLYRQWATVEELNAAGVNAHFDEAAQEIVYADGWDYAITLQPDGFYLRLINPRDEKVSGLRSSGWGDCPRRVWQ